MPCKDVVIVSDVVCMEASISEHTQTLMKGWSGLHFPGIMMGALAPFFIAFSGGAGPVVPAPLCYAAVASAMVLSATLYLRAAQQPASLNFRI